MKFFYLLFYRFILFIYSMAYRFIYVSFFTENGLNKYDGYVRVFFTDRFYERNCPVANFICIY